MRYHCENCNKEFNEDERGNVIKVNLSLIGGKEEATFCSFYCLAEYILTKKKRIEEELEKYNVTINFTLFPISKKYKINVFVSQDIKEEVLNELKLELDRKGFKEYNILYYD